MDVGMSSIQAYKAHKQERPLVSKVHKQGAARHILIPKHLYISGCPAYLTTKHFFHIFQVKLLYYFLINFCNLELISILQLSCSHWCRDAWEDVPSCPLFVHLAYQCMVFLVCVLCRPVCWTSRHPFDFIWNLFAGLFVHFLRWRSSNLRPALFQE